MEIEAFQTVAGRQAARQRYKAGYKRSHKAVGWGDTNPSFTCRCCGAFVAAAPSLSGVGHRNHCPYCLWSRHVDLYRAGDRLCACKADMQPVGLTLKDRRKKYGRGGELMLVHQCVACLALSINRTAADDLPDRILAVYRASLASSGALMEQMAADGIRPLRGRDERMVRRRLYGEPLAVG